MRTDLVVDLVKAGVAGDGSSLRRSAEALAADEQAKKHTGVAQRITRALSTPPNPHRADGLHRAMKPPPNATNAGVTRTDPARPLTDLYLDPLVARACEEFLEEHHRADVLRAHGLEPRHRVLLVGPPGNGKTSLAEAMAHELGLPLLTVRYDAVVTSYLGETAQRLRRLFDSVRAEPCVLFFDEFDAIGKERGDIHETGEIKRVVSTLLLQLDELPPYCVLVGATNHPELLDRAAWRRFQLKMSLEPPSHDELERYFRDRLRQYPEKPGYTAARLVRAVEPSSYSDAEAFFMDVRRRFVLTQGTTTFRTLLDDRVSVWQSLKGVDENKRIDEQPSDPAIR